MVHRSFLPTAGRFALAVTTCTPTLPRVTRGGSKSHSFPVGRVALVAILSALVFTTALPASSTYARYYVDQLYLGNSIEEQGLDYQGRTVAIDNAYCLGLRRYGVQTNTYGLDRFWRFKCTMNAANGHTYDSQISVTHGPKPTWVYWHYLTVKRLY